MAKSSPVNRHNWRERAHPWLIGLGPGFDREKEMELGIFEKQAWIETERRKRRAAFEESLRQQREEFDAEEARRRLDILMPYKSRLWHYDIEKLRRLEVPAYTFDRFQELPVELQLRIWSLAARAAKPQIHAIVSMNQDKGYWKKGSSRILCDTQAWVNGNRLSVMLNTCRNSRKVAQKTSSLFPFKYGWYCERSRLQHFNTLYDTYYIGGERWSDFKVLVDILIKHNTTRTLKEAVRNDLHMLQAIRNLAIDFNHFADTPPTVWTEFRELETFTIVLYPSYGLYELDEEVYTEEITFVKPKRGSFWGNRAKWTLSSAKEVLERVKEEHAPEWKVPVIEVTVRVTGYDYVDEVVEESWAGEETDNDDDDQDEDENENEDEDEDEVEDEDEDDEEEEEEEEEDDNEGEHEDDDIKWQQAAVERMTRKISEAEISKLKRKYFPARR